MSLKLFIAPALKNKTRETVLLKVVSSPKSGFLLIGWGKDLNCDERDPYTGRDWRTLYFLYGGPINPIGWKIGVNILRAGYM
jgi:hypothetical protein